ncbi:MAG: sulfatase-like hydrolase/transferase, partial [Lachnospiraceae bacterium]|nr:sulfatase-like hydrolase/transferase [Lachnospiraceae bacterium]
MLLSVVLGAGTAAYEGKYSAVSDLFRLQYEYDTSTQTFGLMTGTLLDFVYRLPGMKTVSFVSASDETGASESGDSDNLQSALEQENASGDEGEGSSEIESVDEAENGKDGATGSGEEGIIDGGTEDSSENEGDSGNMDREGDHQEEAEPEAVEYGYNVLDIDFDALIASETDSSIIALHEYVSGLTLTSQNEYTGLFTGKNLILITAEAFSAQVINEELTPTLYRLANQGIQFTDFYQPAWGGSTSTGEYSVLLGLVPTNGVSSMYETIGKNVYYTMGNMLGQQGYSTLAFHNGTYTVYRRNETHTNLGYDNFLTFGSGLLDIQEWSNYDEDTISAILENYVDDQPFSWYWMTYSGHGSYKAGDGRTTRNIERVREVLGDTYKDTT